MNVESGPSVADGGTGADALLHQVCSSTPPPVLVIDADIKGALVTTGEAPGLHHDAVVLSAGDRVVAANLHGSVIVRAASTRCSASVSNRTAITVVMQWLMLLPCQC